MDRVIGESLESLAFLEPVRQSAVPDGDVNTGWHWTRLELTEYGLLHLGLEEATLIEIATTLFGGEPPNREAWLDTLNEVVNIVGGRLASAIGGESKEVKLELPVILPEAPDLKDGIVGAYTLDGAGGLVITFQPKD